MRAPERIRSPRWQTFRRVTLHAFRVALFGTIILLIHFQHARTRGNASEHPVLPLTIDQVVPLLSSAVSIGEPGADGSQQVEDADGQSLGYVLQTSPISDNRIGFSGPTNMLIGFGPDDRILGVKVLSSGDTRDHVRQVEEDPDFLGSFAGMSWSEAASGNLDAVSGATLTSLCIRESIAQRLGGGKPSLRFSYELELSNAQLLFPEATTISRSDQHSSLWQIAGAQGALGTILRTSPSADNLIGYQGPTEAMIGFSEQGKVVGIALLKSYDNEPYVGYVREDRYFLSLFNDASLDSLAELDVYEAGVEGVSGATMTSTTVAEGIVAAAASHREAIVAAAAQPEQPTIAIWTRRNIGTSLVIAAGIVIGMTSLRSRPRLRVLFQLVLIVYLGLINGDMLSQAMFVGWAQHGVPWRGAFGLVLLTAAAILVPLTTRRNIYCTHLCPHGAAQQLLRNRLPWRVRLPKQAAKMLRLLPALLLAWCVLVAMLALPFSLVDIEPFDAWVIRVAGWPTITIAIVGLVASLFVPMAYCRYGCPTGAMLEFLRFHGQSDRWSRRDSFVVGLVLLAVGLMAL